ncbi:hypothetical protein EXU57_08130 [Segetibacter sp. 3557_3]|uniref:N-6 DNA methylase n=1 Tax=Segetibacter sp. 3557_3 TaxID=2547429 RepID=UPI00105856DA|nr:N-6 DNA methylase [Segetibacter sp. 3557_3]TDH27068.1 hypothetical protein EXU57_08130 [Segetibacter sp. 3557_3]
MKNFPSCKSRFRQLYKQLNFVQHNRSILELSGMAAVVVPDNVFFEGGAGETMSEAGLKDFRMNRISYSAVMQKS